MCVDRPAVEVGFESVEERSAMSEQKLRKLSSSLLNLMVRVHLNFTSLDSIQGLTNFRSSRHSLYWYEFRVGV